jgi:hypothetical protein
MIFWGSSAVVPLLVDESPRQMRDVAMYDKLCNNTPTTRHQARLDAPGTLHHVMVCGGWEHRVVFVDDVRRDEVVGGWPSSGVATAAEGKRLLPTCQTLRRPGTIPSEGPSPRADSGGHRRSGGAYGDGNLLIADLHGRQLLFDSHRAFA